MRCTSGGRAGSGISPVSVELIADTDLVTKARRCRTGCTAILHAPAAPRRCTGTGGLRVRCFGSMPRWRCQKSMAGAGPRESATGSKPVPAFDCCQPVLEFSSETPCYDPIITVEPAARVFCPADGAAARHGSVRRHGTRWLLSVLPTADPAGAPAETRRTAQARGTICTFLSGDYPSGALAIQAAVR